MSRSIEEYEADIKYYEDVLKRAKKEGRQATAIGAQNCIDNAHDKIRNLKKQKETG